jgi:hydrogenase expression/formation protein HypD
VIAGFEPLDLLRENGCLSSDTARKSVVENEYSRAVDLEGNRIAQQVMKQVFEPTDVSGMVPHTAEFRVDDKEEIFFL